jgi:hypothetical protein
VPQAAVVANAVPAVFFLFGHIREDIKNETTITLSEGLEPIRTSIRESQGRIEKIDGELEVLRPPVESTAASGCRANGCRIATSSASGASVEEHKCIAVLVEEERPVRDQEFQLSNEIEADSEQYSD